MRKAVRHALESSTYESPFLCLLILPKWDDTPWRSADILAHENIEILTTLAPSQMRFAPSDTSPETSIDPTHLSPAKWPVDFVIVANRAGRDQWLDIRKLQTIFVPALRRLYAIPDQHIELFPSPIPVRPPNTPPQHPPARPLSNLTPSPN